MMIEFRNIDLDKVESFSQNQELLKKCEIVLNDSDYFLGRKKLSIFNKDIIFMKDASTSKVNYNSRYYNRAVITGCKLGIDYYLKNKYENENDN